MLHDAGLLPFAEPFPTLTNQGMLVVSTPHRRATNPDATEAWMPIPPDDAATLPPDAVQYRSAKMSKSLRNVNTPDAMVAKDGADRPRVYLAFLAPFDQEVEWGEEGINRA